MRCVWLRRNESPAAAHSQRAEGRLELSRVGLSLVHFGTLPLSPLSSLRGPDSGERAPPPDHCERVQRPSATSHQPPVRSIIDMHRVHTHELSRPEGDAFVCGCAPSGGLFFEISTHRPIGETDEGSASGPDTRREGARRQRRGGRTAEGETRHHGQDCVMRESRLPQTRACSSLGAGGARCRVGWRRQSRQMSGVSLCPSSVEQAVCVLRFDVRHRHFGDA